MKVTTLKARCRRWQYRAGLADFGLQIETKANLRVSGKVCHAAVGVIDQRITITFDEKVLTTFDKEALDQLICHEFQHVIDDAEDGVLLKYLGKDGVVYKEWAEANEKSCDHRAAVLVNAYRRKRDRHSK